MEIVNLTEVLIQTNAGYLAVSVVILLALGTAFTIFNINPIKDRLEKQEGRVNKLKEEADSLLVQARDEVMSSIESFKFENTKALSNALEAESKRQSLEVDNKISIIEKYLSEKIEKLTKLQTTSVLEINEFKSNLKANIKDIKFDIKELMAFKYQQEGKMGGIIYSIELLEDIIKDKGCDDYRIQFRLEDLRDRIKGEPLDSEYIEQIRQLIDKLRKGNFANPDNILRQVEDNIKSKADIKE